MSWDLFVWFAVVALLFWLGGAAVSWKGKRPMFAVVLTLLGLVVFFSFIVAMWISLERPPMRTMGETRLWYAFFLPLAGLITYARWRYKWILSFSLLLSVVFIGINLFRPEIHNKTLMPALQSPWFAPHVIVYMFAYAMLGAAATWLAYLCYLHFRIHSRYSYRKALIGLLLCFLLLQMCWYGINYLPSAQATSVHTYNLNSQVPQAAYGLWHLLRTF